MRSISLNWPRSIPTNWLHTALMAALTLALVPAAGTAVVEGANNDVIVRFTGVVALRQTQPGGPVDVVIPNSSQGFFHAPYQVDPHVAYLKVPYDDLGVPAQGARQCSFDYVNDKKVKFCVFVLVGEAITLTNLTFVTTNPPSLTDVVRFESVCAGRLDMNTLSNPHLVSASLHIPAAALNSGGNPRSDCTWSFSPPNENPNYSWTSKSVANSVFVEGSRTDTTKPFSITAQRSANPAENLPPIVFKTVPSEIEFGNAPLSVWFEGAEPVIEPNDYHMLLYYSIVTNHNPAIGYHIPSVANGCPPTGRLSERWRKMASDGGGEHHILTGDCPPFLFSN